VKPHYIAWRRAPKAWCKSRVFRCGVVLCVGALACAERSTPERAEGVAGEAGRAGASGGMSGSAGTPSGSDGGTPAAGGAPGQAGAPGLEAGALDAGGPRGRDAGTPDASLGGAEGSFPAQWMHGAANCADSTDPELQVHAYDAATYILRQDKCRTFEAPFIYLLLGTDSALLIDTGATASSGLRDTILPLVGTRALRVAHTHAHGDHVASDARFAGQPSTTLIGTGVGAVAAAFGIEPWPTDTAELDLGGRVLDVLAIPGHEQSHIALYDRTTELLFTGDSLYPGLLFINDWATYRTSMRRLAEFVTTHPVSHVLGAHIEMTATPGVNYPYGRVYQPDEHVLQLAPSHVLELDAALTALGPTPPAAPVAHDDFVIDPQ
jgi:hydroxyacylglutathione hydrolase